MIDKLAVAAQILSIEHRNHFQTVTSFETRSRNVWCEDHISDLSYIMSSYSLQKN